ncbi:4'-phosphopantetheinyl transferase family protein [Paeniglutamicibacter kerguelensis]|uniref:4'-phosphopantetheinyl transferase domain-containing protein n=1 Tax=Paeniglutamicibacter kerguelensis TaxID=254788 RepID=A0ABS4X9X3_9MICC|nr:4'-phosphopantetheinyl transferase superfamily protein [Paeniglutamicibacter kerguelensis]MBP2385264.1 hypothetical protein [Paeniglutamicibacter kerguelensis]
MEKGTGPGFEPGLPALWWAAAPLADAAAHAEVVLRPTELTRAAGYLPGHPRDDFVAGRVLARVLAAELLNRATPLTRDLRPDELELTQFCARCASVAHGTPRLRAPKNDLFFSLSYARTAGWLLLGLAPANRRIGVDLADLDDPVFASTDGDSLFEDYAYAPGERKELDLLPEAQRQFRRAQWWALKEAVAKAAGEGIAGEGGIPVVVGPNRHLLLRSPGTRAMDLEPGTPDTLGNVLPDNLVGSIVWSP